MSRETAASSGFAFRQSQEGLTMSLDRRSHSIGGINARCGRSLWVPEGTRSSQGSLLGVGGVNALSGSNAVSGSNGGSRGSGGENSINMKKKRKKAKDAVRLRGI